MRPENLRDYAIMHSSYLIEKAVGGDESAFSKLVGIWFKRIYNSALKYFGEHDLAMEVTQKTFIAVYKNLAKLKDPGSFKSWLYRIAFNQFHEEERRARKRQVFSIFSSNANEQIKIERSFLDPDQEYRNTELGAVLKELLSNLPEEQRQVVIMKEYEGFKFREIAETLRISENTVKSRLYYGLKSLKKSMIEKNLTKETI